MKRNKKPVWDPENYCPICGGRLPPGARMAGHRCPAATLAGINAADTKARWDDPHMAFPERPIRERLADGFAMLDGRAVM